MVTRAIKAALAKIQTTDRIVWDFQADEFVP